MIFNGVTYEQLSAARVDSPFEGDSVLSPSGELVISHSQVERMEGRWAMWFEK